MRILHLIQRPQLRGAETFAVQIGRIHRQMGHEVKFIALFAHRDGLRLEPGELPFQELQLNEGNRFLDLAGYRILAREIRNFGPDIVQANAGDTLKYAALSRRLFGWSGHLVFRNANNISSFVRSWPQKQYLALMLRGVDSVVSVSENCRKDIVALFPALKLTTQTITIGTPIPVKAGAGRPDTLRRELGIPSDATVLINVGSFVPEKNHLGLLEIFAQVLAHVDGAHLVLVGDGKLRGELLARVSGLSLEGRVHFLGYRQDVPAILPQADLMVMPSFIEGMPGVILEAMAHGVPVVAADVGGIGEVVIDQQTGRLLPSADAGAFAEAILSLLTRPALLNALGERARTFVTEHKSIEKIAGDFLSYYHELTSTID